MDSTGYLLAGLETGVDQDLGKESLLAFSKDHNF